MGPFWQAETHFRVRVRVRVRGAGAHQAVVTLLEREVQVRVDAASIARSCASLSARWRIWCLGGCTFGLCFTPASASYADLYCASGCGPLPPVWYCLGLGLGLG